MSIVTATRTIPADPATTALLVAAPAALDLWPNLQPLDDPTRAVGTIRARTKLGGRPERIIRIRTAPPKPTPTAYIGEFLVEADDGPPISGTVRISRKLEDIGVVLPRGEKPAVSGPQAAVSLEFRTGREDAELDAEISKAAERFLDNVASAARSTAMA